MNEKSNLEVRKQRYFEEYIETIEKYKERYIVFVAIKDTPGSKLSEDEIGIIKKLGFYSFNNDLWKMYIGILVKGITILDKIASNPEQDIEYSGTINNKSISIFSSAYRKNNKCSIRINDVEYAVNRRGINIVVFDCENDKVIDSVVYDSHDGNKYFYRNYLKFYKEEYKSRCSINNIVPLNIDKKTIHIVSMGDLYFWNVIDSIVKYIIDIRLYELKVVFFPFTEKKIPSVIDQYDIDYCFFDDYDIKKENPDILLFTSMNNLWPYKWNQIKSFVEYSRKCYCLPVLLILNGYDKTERINEYFYRLKQYGVKNIFLDAFLYSKVVNDDDNDFLINIGNPKFDSILKKLDENKEIPKEWEKIKGKKIILWLADHDWDTGTNVSFDIYAQLIFDYVSKNEEVALIFRPHPHFVRDTINFGIWEKHDAECLRRYIKNSKNIIWDENTSYSTAYSLCDCVFSDPDSGTIVSSMITRKPIFVLYRNDCDVQRNNEDILNNYYAINNHKDLLSSFEMIIKDEDPQKNLRLAAMEKLITNLDGFNGKRIVEFIFNDLKECSDNNYIDFHVHSNASDGQYSPCEIIEKASSIGVKQIALTDHDSIEGNAEAETASLSYGIKFIPGIEISAQDKEEIHIIGLNIDYHNKELIEFCEKCREERNNRANRIIDYLKLKGVTIDIDEIKTIAGNGNIGRQHFAEWLEKNGYVNNKREAFDKYLDTEDFRNTVKRWKPTPSEAINLIHNAGGKSVLAHPGLLKMNIEEQEELILKLKEVGLDGIECFYSKHTKDQEELYLELSQKYELKISIGSDFHGESVKPNINLGMGISDEYKESLIIV